MTLATKVVISSSCTIIIPKEGFADLVFQHPLLKLRDFAAGVDACQPVGIAVAALAGAVSTCHMNQTQPIASATTLVNGLST